MTIIPLSEGSFTIDKTKVFLPFNEGTDQLQGRSTGSLLVQVQPFLIITSKDVLLLDTGLGFSINGTLQIHQNLKNKNIDPASITKVLLTHLHKDHAGGVSLADRVGNVSLAFPQATYYIQKQEVDYAIEIGFPSYMMEELGILQNNQKVELLHGDGTIDNYIRYQLAGGHSPYHQVYWITENNETIFFGGDNAPTYHQMKSKVVAKYDFDGKKSMEMRQQWWQQGLQEQWTFLFYHDIETPFIKARPSI